MNKINIILKLKTFLKHCKLNIDYWLLKGKLYNYDLISNKTNFY